MNTCASRSKSEIPDPVTVKHARTAVKRYGTRFLPENLQRLTCFCCGRKRINLADGDKVQHQFVTPDDLTYLERLKWGEAPDDSPTYQGPGPLNGCAVWTAGIIPNTCDDDVEITSDGSKEFPSRWSTASDISVSNAGEDLPQVAPHLDNSMFWECDDGSLANNLSNEIAAGVVEEGDDDCEHSYNDQVRVAYLGCRHGQRRIWLRV